MLKSIFQNFQIIHMPFPTNSHVYGLHAELTYPKNILRYEDFAITTGCGFVCGNETRAFFRLDYYVDNLTVNKKRNNRNKIKSFTEYHTKPFRRRKEPHLAEGPIGSSSNTDNLKE